MAAALQVFTCNGYTCDPESSPQPFGHQLKKYWAFDDRFINLNHGSFGSLPLPVFAASVKYQLESEVNPDKFHRITYFPLGIESRELLADFIGAKIDEVVLVPNTTHGVNTVLRNFEWNQGDVILSTTTTYGVVVKSIQYLTDLPEQQRPVAYTLNLTFPMTHAQIVNDFRNRIRELKQQHAEISRFLDTPDAGPANSGVRKNKFVAVIDSVVSGPGVLLPWQELVKICREEGPNINLSDSKPDFWVSNAHKWLYAKRGCAMLYDAEQHQHIIKTSIPTSHMYKEKGNLWRPNEIPGQWTSPPTSLSNQHSHSGPGLEVNSESLPTATNLRWLTNVRLPLPRISELAPGVAFTKSKYHKIDNLLRDKLLYEWNVYAAHFFHVDAWWVRCSAQVWNELSDFEYLGEALVNICWELEEAMNAQEGDGSTL